MSLTIESFDSYFRELHGYAPYPWQRRLAAQAVAGTWPGAIDLPTGSGKTACIDIAVFALACQASLPVEDRTSPRRVFFCVNRRVIVDEAHARARRIAEAIWTAEQSGNANCPVLQDVASALRSVAGTSSENSIPPLDVVELRGGIYRDSRWARSIIQPTIICTTLDQLGSRLLFRGYGISPNAASIQAALIAYDSMILLDEAHISEPFRQTLDYVQCYLNPQKWVKEKIGVHPVCVVPITATPNEEMAKRGVIELEDADRQYEGLLARLAASKPTECRKTKNIVDETISIIKSLDEEMPVSVGIIVNRVATAKYIFNSLCELKQQSKEPSKRKKSKIDTELAVELVIGSMRPIDRDEQAERLCEIVGHDRPSITQHSSLIVATQCLEVGADYDFDILITECASLDALRQRFGRLNRAGRNIAAKAIILAKKEDIKPDNQLDDAKPLDPIYGNALARTWNWLVEHSTDQSIDFGIDAFNAILEDDKGYLPKNLFSPSALLKAPAMMPAYLDLWCQTAPKPTPDPDVSLFIHGSQGCEQDVQICWRADLVEDGYLTHNDWCEVVMLLPPTSAECMSVPISRVRSWFADQSDNAQNQGDVLGIDEDVQNSTSSNGSKYQSPLKHPCVLWRGIRDSKLIQSAEDLRPGDTLVLPASDSGSGMLGHLPHIDHGPLALGVNDIAELAFVNARDLASLRLHPTLRSHLPTGEVFDHLFDAAANHDEPPTCGDWSAMLKAASDAVSDETDLLKQTLFHLSDKSVQIESYPDERGLVLITRCRLNTSTGWFIRPMDEGEDEASRIQRNTSINLTAHTSHVLNTIGASLACLPMKRLAIACKLSAKLHDIGKADERFQAMLRRTSRTDAWLIAGMDLTVLAKSDGMPMTRTQRDFARRRAGLPRGFRHETLSAQLAELSDLLPDDPCTRDMVLHLIVAHHGHARPLVPVVIDDELPPIDIEGFTMSNKQRLQLTPPHRFDSGIADRFWSLTRHFGWWGLAYLEAVLRLADQQASAVEDAGKEFSTHGTMEYKI